ncbi:hypothetical protein D3C72_1792810 [compost metagenome]
MDVYPAVDRHSVHPRLFADSWPELVVVLYVVDRPNDDIAVLQPGVHAGLWRRCLEWRAVDRID